MSKVIWAHATHLQDEYDLKHFAQDKFDIINGLKLSSIKLEILADSLDRLTN